MGQSLVQDYPLYGKIVTCSLRGWFYSYSSLTSIYFYIILYYQLLGFLKNVNKPENMFFYRTTIESVFTFF